MEPDARQTAGRAYFCSLGNPPRIDADGEPLFDDNGDRLCPALIIELDEIKDKRPTGGMMLRRDGTGRSWVGKDEQLTQVERKCREIIDMAGLPPVIDADGEPQKLTFTSFGRHGGATESMGNYLHGNDAG